MSTTADGKGMLDNFEIDDPVRSNDLRPTGMSTTENSSGALDDLNSNETLDNLDLDSCPGDVRPTRIMAESLSKVIVPEMLASSDPKVWPGLTVLDPPNSTNQYKADKSWISTEYGEMRPENKAREAGVATQITEEIAMISRICHLKNSSYARSDISTHLIIGKSAHSSIAEGNYFPPIPGKEEEKRLRKKTKTKRQKGPSKVRFLEQVEDCACAEESCKRPPDNARYDDEDDREGPGVALLDSSSDDEDIPDVRLSVTKQKVLRERRLSQRPNTHPDIMSRDESRHDDRHGRLLEQIEKMFGGREATMRVAEGIREAYDSKIAKDKPRAISAR
jgi:hypothetical protein